MKLFGRDKLSILVFIILVIGMSGWFMVSQLYVDDWVYLHRDGPFMNNYIISSKGLMETLRQAGDFIYTNYVDVNGRLSDKLLIFFLLFPQWIGRLIIACSFGIFAWWFLRFCSLRDHISGAVAVLSILLLLILSPWYHYFSALAIEFNYILPAAFILPILYIFIRSEGKAIRPATMTGLILLAFFGGMMHEGFSLPVIGAMVWILFIHRRLNRLQWILLVVFAAGTAIMFFAPGTLKRMNTCNPGIFVPLYWRLFILFTPAAPGALLALLIACRKLRGGPIVTREHLSGLTFISFLTAFGAILIAATVGSIERALWFPSVLCVIVIMRCLQIVLPKPGYPRIIHFISGFLATGLAVWFFFLIKEQYEFGQTQKLFIEKIEHDRAPICYIDLQNTNDSNPWLLRFTDPPIPKDSYHFDGIGYFLIKKYVPVVPLPAEFRDRHYLTWPRPVSSSSLPIYGKYPIYFTPERPDSSLVPLNLTFEIGEAPLSPYNFIDKLRGVKEKQINIWSSVIQVPMTELDSTLQRNFRSEVITDADTLYFLLPGCSPRPCLYAPVKEICK